MARRLLLVSPDFLVSLIDGMTDGPPRWFKVTDDPIPSDARIISVCMSQYWSYTVEIELESPQWEEAGPRAQVRPQFATVILPANDVVLDTRCDQGSLLETRVGFSRHPVIRTNNDGSGFEGCQSFQALSDATAHCEKDLAEKDFCPYLD